MISGINHLTWNVADIEEAFGFYVGVLGFTPVMKSDRSAYFLAGDVWIAVVKGESRFDARYDHIAFHIDRADYPGLIMHGKNGRFKPRTGNVRPNTEFRIVGTTITFPVHPKSALGSPGRRPQFCQ